MGCLAGSSAAAQGMAKTDADVELLAQPWVVPPPQRSPEAYFTNVKSGDAVSSPFLLAFGLSMRGLVPAGHAAGSAGHHHLLINQPLPLDFTKALPFTEKYIHFGKGQMDAVVDLPPGDYEFRLVLADQGHIPYFVYSKPLRLKVTEQRKGVAAKDVLGPPRVEIVNLADNQALKPPLRLQFHAYGYNIGHQAAQVPDTHYFRLLLERTGARPEVMDFKSGRTEVWLNPPKGPYTARLELVRNLASAEPVAARSRPVSFVVE